MKKIYRYCLVTAFVAINAGCGGGGPQTGECLFPLAAACNPTNGTGVPSSPASPSTPAQPAFVQTGVGDTQFSLPANLSIINVEAEYAGSSSNFILYAETDLIINEVIGTSQLNTKIQGTYAVPAGSAMRITGSNGVSWRISTSNPTQASPATLLSSGTGDQVLYLPARNSNYRIMAAYPSTSQNFILYANDTLVVNEIIGTSSTPQAYDGIIALPASARVEIRGSVGVIWSLAEIR